MGDSEKLHRLHRVWSDERETKNLQPLADDFYAAMGEYIREKAGALVLETEKSLARGAKPDERELTQMLAEALESDVKKIAEVYRARDEKIINAITAGTLEEEKLSADEKILYRSFISAHARQKEKALGAINGSIAKAYQRMLKLAHLYSTRPDKTIVLEPNAIKPGILEMLDGARHSVYVVSPWIWGVEEIVERFEALKGKNCDVRVVCRPAMQDDKGHGSLLAKLNELNIPAQLNDHVHSKFIIADEVEVLFSSANLTATSLERNVEHGMRTHDLSIVEKYVGEFEKLWRGEARAGNI
ncbi:MAG: phospholipase D-like domain-containing protein [Candidatus Micrarchaeota archaeon]